MAIVGFLALSFWLSQLIVENETAKEIVSQFGHVGIFMISVISGFNLAVPIPAIAFLPIFTGAGLNFWIIVILVTAGMTVGDALGYLLGRAGSHLMESKMSDIIERLEHLRNEYRLGPLAALLIFASFIPLPNELIIIPLGFLGYQMKYVIIITFIGSAIFNTLAALGITNLLELL